LFPVIIQKRLHFQNDLNRAGGRIYRDRDSFAHFPPAREVPLIWEIPALLGLHGVDHAVIALKEDAGVVRSINDGKTPPVGSQPSVALKEKLVRHPEKSGDFPNLSLRNFHVSRPPAAVCASLALVEDFRIYHKGSPLNT
jgi:hypothetical protein